MGRPRIGENRLSKAERQLRYRTAQAAYVAALEDAALDALVLSVSDYQARHAPTLRRALAAYRERHPEVDAPSPALL